MIIEANRVILVLRYSQYKNYNFVDEHKQIIDEHGEVWMLKLGRKIPTSSIENVIKDGGTLVLKSPKKTGDKYFIAMFDSYRNGLPSSEFSYPNYYEKMLDESYDFTFDGTWLRLRSIKEMTDVEVSKLVLQKSGKLLSEVIRSTRTSVLYAISTESLSI